MYAPRFVVADLLRCLFGHPSLSVFAPPRQWSRRFIASFFAFTFGCGVALAVREQHGDT